MKKSYFLSISAALFFGLFAWGQNALAFTIGDAHPVPRLDPMCRTTIESHYRALTAEYRADHETWEEEKYEDLHDEGTVGSELIDDMHAEDVVYGYILQLVQPHASLSRKADTDLGNLCRAKLDFDTYSGLAEGELYDTPASGAQAYVYQYTTKEHLLSDVSPALAEHASAIAR
jgi:hypothetical protein